MGILEKISEVEKEISRTQKNKGTVIILLLLHHSNLFFSYRISFGTAESKTRKI